MTRSLFNISRRGVLKGAGALGLAGAAWPKMALSQDGTVLTVRSYSDLQVLDPAFRLAAPEGDIIREIFPGLVTNAQGDDWTWELYAAEEMEQIDDVTIFFRLKDGIMFTDGYGQMTADDVKFSIERIADPAVESPYAGDWAALSEVEVIDDLSGRIHLTEAFAPLWSSTLPTPSCSILSRRAMEERGEMTTEPFAQSGPYIMTEWVPRQRTTLVRNPDWPGEPGGYEEIHIVPIEDPSTAELGFEAGDLDYTWTAVSSVQRLRENPPAGGVVVEKPSLAYVWMGLNAIAPPLDNPLVRRAIQHAIDRQTVVDAAYFGAAEVSTGIIAPGLPGHRDAVLYDYDPDRARELLAEAGVSDLFVTLDILNQSERLTAAQVIQANLADVGITCEIKQNDSGTFWTLGDEASGDYWQQLQLILGRFSMEPDPSWATVWFTPEQVGVWNWERFDNAEYAELHRQGLVTLDPAERDVIYKRMQDIMDESGQYVFLTHEVTGILHRDTVSPALKPNGEPLLGGFTPA
ncbi:twin-arginine translocation signal domain-containing protein [Rhodobacterales bacterium HKCCE3408]|nr:twin-arginine translocation signal domain-containing protein [Rhodobacterales bacterium HKCCE3408]